MFLFPVADTTDFLKGKYVPWTKWKDLIGQCESGIVDYPGTGWQNKNERTGKGTLPETNIAPKTGGFQ